MPLEFLLLGLTLLGVAVFHEHPLTLALAGLAGLVLIKASRGFDFVHHLRTESALVINLFGLLLGFAVLARHFEDSHLPGFMPRLLPDNWLGPFMLLVFVFILSAFLDNIAAALIGGTVAFAVFQGKVHIGYLAALTAASNAGGAFSVLGDTTTTMLWIGGVPVLKVLPAFVGSVTALICFGLPAAFQQQKFQAILKDPIPGLKLKWNRIALTLLALVAAAIANVWLGLPALGVWTMLLLASPRVPLPWKILGPAARGACFLVALVLCASLMPVESLPSASWQSTLMLGLTSAFFDNIPLTKLALDQGGYDWGLLAYAVGFGGSILWFGSSAGVALSGRFPEIRSAGRWLKNGWHVVLAYFIGFATFMAVVGWRP